MLEKINISRNFYIRPKPVILPMEGKNNHINNCWAEQYKSHYIFHSIPT